MESHADGGHFFVGARLTFKNRDSVFVVIPAIIMTSGGKQIHPAQLPGKEKDDPPLVMLTGLNADDKEIELAFSGLVDTPDDHAQEQLVVEVSVKPMMSILWLGTLLIIGGTAIAFNRRLQGTTHKE
jgi:hypothetical protein